MEKSETLSSLMHHWIDIGCQHEVVKKASPLKQKIFLQRDSEVSHQQLESLVLKDNQGCHTVFGPSGTFTFPHG